MSRTKSDREGAGPQEGRGPLLGPAQNERIHAFSCEQLDGDTIASDLVKRIAVIGSKPILGLVGPDAGLGPLHDADDSTASHNPDAFALGDSPLLVVLKGMTHAQRKERVVQEGETPGSQRLKTAPVSCSEGASVIPPAPTRRARFSADRVVLTALMSVCITIGLSIRSRGDIAPRQKSSCSKPLCACEAPAFEECFARVVDDTDARRVSVAISPCPL